MATAIISYGSGYDSCTISCEEAGIDIRIDSKIPDGWEMPEYNDCDDNWLEAFWQNIAETLRNNSTVAYVVDSEWPCSDLFDMRGDIHTPIPKDVWLAGFDAYS